MLNGRVKFANQTKIILHMKITKLLIALIAFTFFSCETENISQASEPVLEKTEQISNKSNLRYDVIIKLLDQQTGTSVPANKLPGYGAENIETGETFYTSRYEIDLFESLPEGTYRFKAYKGYFDGAYSKTVTLSELEENNEGFFEVTLNYWSE